MIDIRQILARCCIVTAVILPHSSYAAKNGVEVNQVVAATALRGFTNFDPPSLFQETLPLGNSLYLNPKTLMVFISGNGAVLNEAGNFDVSGYSPPNFLAWNCEARNADFTVPKLPAIIKFLVSVKSFSFKFGAGFLLWER